MIKKLHGLDGYSFMTTQALINYFAGLDLSRKTYEQDSFFTDFRARTRISPMGKYLVLCAVLFF